MHFLCALFLTLHSFLLPSPVYAISSVNSCSTDPQCAAAIGLQTGIRNSIVSGSTAANNIVPWTLKSASTGATISSGSNAISVVGGTAAFATAAGVAIFGFNDFQKEALTKQAVDDYCQSTGLCQGTTPLKVTLTISGHGQTGVSDPFVWTQPVDCDDGSCVREQNGIVQVLSGGDWFNIFDISNGGSYTADYIPPENPDFNSFDNATKEQIVNNISDQQIIEAIAQQGDAIPAPGDNEILEVGIPTINPDGTITESTVVEGTRTVPGGNSSTTVTNPDGSKKTTDTTTTQNPDGSTTTITTDCEYDTAGELVDCTITEETNDPPPDSEESLNPVPIIGTGDSGLECVECEEPDYVTTTLPNFIVYAQEELANVFPFDVIGDIPSDTFNTCPSLTIQNQTMELCIINDLLSLMKYPVWILFLIRLVLHV